MALADAPAKFTAAFNDPAKFGSVVEAVTLTKEDVEHAWRAAWVGITDYEADGEFIKITDTRWIFLSHESPVAGLAPGEDDTITRADGSVHSILKISNLSGIAWDVYSRG